MSRIVDKLRNLQKELADENLPTALYIYVEPAVLDRVRSEVEKSLILDDERDHGYQSLWLRLDHGGVKIGLC